MISKSDLIKAIDLRHTVRRYKPVEIDPNVQTFIFRKN
ncbi:hypothetical protein N581_09615 [Lactobacillus jensenii MD IIE-70(2)]|jgi:hypothetical protein|nr:hypothetical protein LACJE0001_1339 [Lactobacillus jensenii 269-3]ERJ43319.1 hypothetical protein N581_09615 [Lactobacillus jensenii MD IIE-70(2)]